MKKYMNEQINKLVDETASIMPGVYSIVYENGKRGVEFNEEALYKFAELIVKQCIWIDKENPDAAPGVEIARYFGV